MSLDEFSARAFTFLVVYGLLVAALLTYTQAGDYMFRGTWGYPVTLGVTALAWWLWNVMFNRLRR